MPRLENPPLEIPRWKSQNPNPKSQTKTQTWVLGFGIWDLSSGFTRLFARRGFEFFREQQLRRRRDCLVVGFQTLTNKPTLLERLLECHFDALKRIVGSLTVNPGGAFVPHDGGARQVHARLRLAGNKNVAGHRRAREQAGRVGADQKKESTPLHLWLNGWRGPEKKSIDGSSIRAQSENSRSGRSRRQSFTGAKIELHQGIGKRSE